jgi:hypothetical protein
MTELSPEVKKLLAAGRESFSPAAERLTAVRSAIAARTSLPPGKPLPPGGGAALKGAGLGVQKLIGIGLLVAAGAGAGMIGYRTMQPGEAPPPVPAIEPAEAPASGPASDIQAAPDSYPAAEPVVAPASQPADAPAPAAPKRRRTSPAAAGPQPGPDPVDPAAAVGASQPPGKSSAPDPAPATDRLAEELSLIGAARAALRRGDAAGALSLLDRHRADFPRGKLQPEQLLTRVLALCKRGRVSEARAAAAELRRVSPGSSYPQQIRASCAGEPDRQP